jgi:hypothetical protein
MQLSHSCRRPPYRPVCGRRWHLTQTRFIGYRPAAAGPWRWRSFRDNFHPSSLSRQDLKVLPVLPPRILMANERLTLQIDAKTTGQAEVQALSDALNKVVSISEKAGKSGSAFSSFPPAIKSFVQDPLGSAEHALSSFASGFGPLGIAVSTGIGVLSAFAAASSSAARSLAETGTSTRDLSLKLGLPLREVAQFGFAARSVGAV